MDEYRSLKPKISNGIETNSKMSYCKMVYMIQEAFIILKSNTIYK